MCASADVSLWMWETETAHTFFSFQFFSFKCEFLSPPPPTFLIVFDNKSLLPVKNRYEAFLKSIIRSIENNSSAWIKARRIPIESNWRRFDSLSQSLVSIVGIAYSLAYSCWNHGLSDQLNRVHQWCWLCVLVCVLCTKHKNNRKGKSKELWWWMLSRVGRDGGGGRALRRHHHHHHLGHHLGLLQQLLKWEASGGLRGLRFFLCSSSSP